MKSFRRHPTRWTSAVGGLLLGASISISLVYAPLPLVAAGAVIYADTSRSDTTRYIVSSLTISAMIGVVIWSILDGELFPLPGAALLLASAVWTLLRHPEQDGDR